MARTKTRQTRPIFTPTSPNHQTDHGGSDDDFVPPEDGINEPSSPSSLTTGLVARSAKKRHRQCTENVRYSPPKKRVALPSNLQQISQMKNAITKRLQGNDIDANLSLRIVKASLERQETHLRYNHKIGKKANKGAKPPRVIIK